MNDKVLVVLSNYKRPQNIPLCIKAWKGQSHPPSGLVVMDNSDSDTDWEVLGADSTWKVKPNLGPLCRIWPAIALAPQFDYVLFADDDLLPGREGLKAALDTAHHVSNKCATVGQEGRTFSSDGTEDMGRVNTTWSYKFGNTPRYGDRPRVVDCTVRCHLVLAKYLHRTLLLRERVPAQLCQDHDDLLLCLGLQVNLCLPSYVLPASTLERQLIKENLPGCNGPEACWKRPDHITQRNQFINIAQDKAGWRPFSKDGDL